MGVELENLPFSMVEPILNRAKNSLLMNQQDAKANADSYFSLGNTTSLAITQDDLFFESFCNWLRQFRNEYLQMIQEDFKKTSVSNG